jgi:signal transduction histidine kinase
MSTNLHDLIGFSGKPSGLQWLDLSPLVQDICDSLQSRLSSQAITVELDIPMSTRIQADSRLIRQALVNLVLNALDAMPNMGQLQITSWTGPGGVELEIADSGDGIDTNRSNQLFDTNYTTKGQGRGQGLTVAQQVIELHGGQIVACNCPQGGAAFTITFPIQAVQAAA